MNGFNIHNGVFLGGEATAKRGVLRSASKPRETGLAEYVVRLRKFEILRMGVIGALAGTLAGCASLNPNPVTEAELAAAARSDQERARRGVEPIHRPLTLEEALARALKYNLDRRARMLEEAVALGQFEVGKYDMLPRLMAQAGYRSRSEELMSRSRDSVTGLPSSANPSISTERNTVFTDLGATWNVLDFGVSYFFSRQNADRVLIAAERRRKAMHVLMQDTRTAFWRTASAQRLQGEVSRAIKLAQDALADARRVEATGTRSPIEGLRYQRQLLENLRLLEAAQQELATAKVELALLINAPIESDLRVVEPKEHPGANILSVAVMRLEEVAIARNADLREQVYNSRIAVEETRKVITRLFPGLSFGYDIRYDSNAYLVNNQWNEAGLSLSFNLLNLLSGPAQVKMAESGVALADQRRIATQMATLAQVHIARLQYASALGQLDRAEGISGIDRRIGAIVSSRAEAQVQSKLEAVANQVTSILSLMRRYQALAQAHAAASKLQATLGLDPEIGDVGDVPLVNLARVIKAAQADWDRGVMPQPRMAGSARR
jgi:outer membrane protein TolC